MTLKPTILKHIEEEQEAVSKTFASLTSQLNKSSARFHKERKRARALTSGLVRARAEDKVQLASDEAISHSLTGIKQGELETLEALLKKPYFGRIVVEELVGGSPKQFEYKIGYAANPDCRIVDWRKAPISKLYYEYKEGDEYCEEILNKERSGKVLLRNSITASRDTLCQITCRYGTFKKNGSGWEQISKYRSKENKSGGLPNILSLITPEQFRTITEDCQTAVLIQGIAGSGKTTVALHRLAWLLHEDNSDITPSECLVLVLNEHMKRYVAHTLPSMGIDGVKVKTYLEWAKELVTNIPELKAKDLSLNTAPMPSTVKRVKSSMAVLLRLEEYQHELNKSLISKIEDDIPWDNLPTGINDLYSKLLSKFLNRRLSLRDLLRELLSGLEKASSVISPSHPRAKGIKGAISSVKGAMGACCVLLTPLIEIFHDPKKIMALDNSGLVDRDSIDLALKYQQENLNQGLIDECDLALLLRLCHLVHGKLFSKDGERAFYKHIVLDEVQDFSPPALASVIGSVKDPHALTIVGDTEQQLQAEAPFPGWEALQKHWKFSPDMSRFIKLNVSHRSTRQIMALASYVIGSRGQASGREGKAPIWFKCENETEGVKTVMEWLKKARERFPDSLTALICPDHQSARYAYSLLKPFFGADVRLAESGSLSFEAGLIVAEVRQTKGLEFHCVCLWNPSKKSYPQNDYSRRALYTAITRAENHLSMVLWDTPCPFLPNPLSKLVRFVDYTD